MTRRRFSRAGIVVSRPSRMNDRIDRGASKARVLGRRSASIGRHRTMPPMLPDGRRLGAHLPLATGMVKAVERAHEIGASAIQIFTDNPTAWRRRAEPPAELAAFRERPASQLDIAPVAIHASYLVNLAGPDPDVRSSARRHARRRAARRADVRGALRQRPHRLASRGTGIDASASARVGRGRPAGAWPRSTTARDAAMLVLENSAGGGWRPRHERRRAGGASPTAIGARGRRPPTGVGFCLDTAHAWGAGIDVGDAVGDRRPPRRLRRADRARPAGHGPPQRLALRASARARTATSTSARAGSGRSGLAHVLRHPALAHAAYILETPGMDEGYDAINLARARALAAGEPLAAAARPAAFELAAAPRARTAPA